MDLSIKYLKNASVQNKVVLGDNKTVLDCTYKKIKLYGEIKFVEHFPENP